MPIFRLNSTADAFSTLRTAHWLHRIGLHLGYLVGPVDEWWQALPDWLTTYFDIPAPPKSIPKSDIAGHRRWLAQYLSRIEIPDAPPSGQLWQNITWLSERLALDADEQALLTLSVCMFEHFSLSQALRYIEASGATDSYRKLACILDISDDHVRRLLNADGKLIRLGLLNATRETRIFSLHHLLEPDELLTETLCTPHPNADAMFRHFTKTEPLTLLAKSDFNHLRPEWEILSNTLRSAVTTSATGINILLYGATGAGKTELAKAIVQSLGLTLFAVPYEKMDGRTATGNERLTSYQVTQHMLAKHSKAVVIFDEAEDVFVHESFLHQNQSSIDYSKAWLNKILESNLVPTIWIANCVHQTDPAYRRRFDLVLKLRALPQSTRLRLVTGKLQQHALSDPLQQDLASMPNLLPYHVEKLNRVLAHFHGNGKKTCVDMTPDQIAGIWLRENATLFDANPRRFTPYINGSAAELHAFRFPFDWRHFGLSEEDRTWLSHLLACKTVPDYAMLIAGPPGAGKTTFVEQLSQHFDVPIVERSIVDFLSWQPGETERQLHRLFLFAQQTESLLLLEDIDAYRPMLQQAPFDSTYTEQSIKRILLDCLNSFDGMFIATARNMQMIDDEILQKLEARIAIGYLSAVQNDALFAQLCSREAMTKQPLLCASIETLRLVPSNYVDALKCYRHQTIGLSTPSGARTESPEQFSSTNSTLDPRRLLDLLKARTHARAALSA